MKMNSAIGDCKKRFWILLLTASVFFLGLLAVSGIGIYNDSEQYISMHIHRDPGYPFFLWIFRRIFGDGYLSVVVVLQALVCAWCSASFTEYMAETFDLGKCSAVVIFFLTLVPHIITPLFSVSRFVMSAGIMSEALCLPLFLLFIKEMHKVCVSDDRCAVWTSLGLGVLLSLIRAQVTAAMVLWLIVLILKAVWERTYKKILLWIVVLALCFAGKSLVIRTYNLAFQGHFINTTYGAVNTLTNILYASDRDLRERIEDPALQEVFDTLYDSMEEKQYHHSSAPDTWKGRAEHLEDVHDDLKFEVCELGLQQYLQSQGITDYIKQNVESDKIASELMKELLPGCFGRWLGNYLMLGWRGAVRNVAVVHPLLSIYAAGAAVAAVVLMVALFYRDRKSKEAWLMLISLLTIAGISYSTALTIMCLSRYMVYGFTGFYTAGYLILLYYKNRLLKTI